MGANSLATTDRIHSDRGLRDWLLFALTVSSGAVDAISFLALGKVFTAFMTGNLAFLGMGIAGSAGAPGRLAVLASMAGFAGGVYICTIIVTPSRQPATQQSEPATKVVWPQDHIRPVYVAAAPPRIRGDMARGRWPARLRRYPRTPGRLGARNGNAERRGSLARRGRRVHHGRDRHLHLLAGSFARRPLTGEERRRLSSVLASLVIGGTVGAYLLMHAPAYAPLLPLVITVAVVAIAAKVFGSRDDSHVSAGESARQTPDLVT